MSTRIEVEYDRANTDADVQAIIARATATINVMQQLGVAFQTLPGYAMVAYQTETDAQNALLAQITGPTSQGGGSPPPPPPNP